MRFTFSGFLDEIKKNPSAGELVKIQQRDAVNAYGV